MNRVIVSCMIGNALEWYEFTLYGYFASIIGKLFFPSEDPLVSLISAFAVFAAGFLMRPLGALLFGHIGDKLGRKKALLISIYLMAFPTAAIGLLPTYESLGWIASLILTLIRLLQGVSIGGEFTGSMVFIIEHSPSHKRGISGSYASLSLAIGIILGSATATAIFKIFTMEEIYQWAWRIPFLLSVLGAVVGSIMRRTLSDPEVYLKHKEEKKLHTTPLKELFANHTKSILHAVSIEMILAIGFYIVTIFLITYMKQFLHMDEQAAFQINTVNTLVFALFIPLGGWLSDIYGRRLVMLPATLVYLFSYQLIQWMSTGGITGAFFAQMIFAASLGVLFGPIPALLSELFPTKVRYSALAIAHSLSMSIFGGTAPFLVTYALKITGNLNSPAYFLVFGGVVSSLGLFFLKDRFKEDLE
jgi:MHS family proline/betaine transporter-like MFS transporter